MEEFDDLTEAYERGKEVGRLEYAERVKTLELHMDVVQEILTVFGKQTAKALAYKHYTMTPMVQTKLKTLMIALLISQDIYKEYDSTMKRVLSEDEMEKRLTELFEVIHKRIDHVSDSMSQEDIEKEIKEFLDEPEKD